MKIISLDIFLNCMDIASTSHSNCLIVSLHKHKPKIFSCWYAQWQFWSYRKHALHIAQQLIIFCPEQNLFRLEFLWHADYKIQVLNHSPFTYYLLRFGNCCLFALLRVYIIVFSKNGEAKVAQFHKQWTHCNVIIIWQGYGSVEVVRDI